MKTLTIILALFLVACADRPPKERFWYPYKKFDVVCYGYSGSVYLMRHSYAWVSVPHFRELSSGRWLTIPDACVFIHLESYPDDIIHVADVPSELQTFIKRGD